MGRATFRKVGIPEVGQEIEYTYGLDNRKSRGTVRTKLSTMFIVESQEGYAHMLNYRDKGSQWWEVK